MNQKKLQNYIKQHDLLTTLVLPFDLDLKRTNNELIRILPELKGAFGLVRYQFVDYMQDLDSFFGLLDKPRVLGVKFHPSFDRIPVTHPVFEPIFKILQKRRLVALIHSGRWQEVSHCRYAFQIAKRYPNIHIIVAHMGGNELANTQEAIRLARKHPNTYLETSNCRLNLMIKKAAKTVGEKRILFGTDVPWGSFYANLYTVIETPISEEEKKCIISDNLKSLIETVTC
jgi:predicted TIM-barrel fold metal-dependent hydrolase